MIDLSSSALLQLDRTWLLLCRSQYEEVIQQLVLVLRSADRRVDTIRQVSSPWERRTT